jgi:hypothetical protein
LRYPNVAAESIKKFTCQKNKLGVIRHRDANIATIYTTVRKRFFTLARPIRAVVFLPFEKVENCIIGLVVIKIYAVV